MALTFTSMLYRIVCHFLRAEERFIRRWEKCQLFMIAKEGQNQCTTPLCRLWLFTHHAWKRILPMKLSEQKEELFKICLVSTVIRDCSALSWLAGLKRSHCKRTVERAYNRLNRSLIRHLFGISVRRKASGGKCAARLQPAALKCQWVDADWWGGGLKCGGKKREMVIAGRSV